MYGPMSVPKSGAVRKVTVPEIRERKANGPAIAMVTGHVGLAPQRVHALGGFRVQGKTDDAAERIVADAIALEQAGAYALVLEAMPADVASRVTRAVGIPTIGIGAGHECDGQVLVC